MGKRKRSAAAAAAAAKGSGSGSGSNATPTRRMGLRAAAAAAAAREAKEERRLRREDASIVRRTRNVKVLVIGSGFAGLACARELQCLVRDFRGVLNERVRALLEARGCGGVGLGGLRVGLTEEEEDDDEDDDESDRGGGNDDDDDDMDDSDEEEQARSSSPLDQNFDGAVPPLNIEVVVLEARDRVGGRVCSNRSLTRRALGEALLGKEEVVAGVSYGYGYGGSSGGNGGGSGSGSSGSRKAREKERKEAEAAAAAAAGELLRGGRVDTGRQDPAFACGSATARAFDCAVDTGA